MNFKNKKVIIIISIVLIVIILILGYKIYQKNSNKNKSSQIEYNYSSDNENIDWDLFDKINVNLTNKLSSNNSAIFKNNNLVISDSGVYTLSGTFNGNIIIEGTKNSLIKIILDGVDITGIDGPCIYVSKASNVLLYLNENTTNNLVDSNNYSSITDGEPNGAIFSKSNLMIDGLGILNITANYEDGIVSKDILKILNGSINITSKDDGIRGKDYVYIKNGNIDINSIDDGIKSTNTTDSSFGYILIDDGNIKINSTGDGIQAETNLIINGGTFDIKSGGGSSITSTNTSWGSRNKNTTTDTSSANGLKATNIITINNGIFNLDTSDDSIHSNNEININDGKFNISSGDDGIHADANLELNNTTIIIEKSYEGLESTTITINSGTYNISASDDGINGAGGNDSSSMDRPGANTFSSSNGKLVINGGEVKVIASGDGLDANGSIYITGGNTYVDGPTDNGNGALDYDSELKVTGGTLVATGSNGMLQGISTNSTIYSITNIYNSTQSANTKLSIKDTSDNTIISYIPSKNYTSFVVASPLLEKENTYNIYSGDTKYSSVTISNIVNIIGNQSRSMIPGGNIPPTQRR